MTELDQVKSLKIQFHNDFIWVSDHVLNGVIELWELAKWIDGKWRSDCDSAALRFINLCVEEIGVPVDRLALATCLVDQSKDQEFDHAVALYRDDSGVIWVADNRYPDLHPISWFSYKNWTHSQFGGDLRDDWIVLG